MQPRTTHLSDGEIRSLQDQELAADQNTAGEAHLADCQTCQARAAELLARSQRIQARLDHLPDAPADLPRTGVESARLRLATRLENRKENPMQSKTFLRLPRTAWAALVVVVVLAVSLTFEPVRALANNFLALFRVEQIRVVQIDPDELEEKLESSSQLEYILSNEVQVEEKGEAQKAASAEEASALAGYPLRLPVGLEGKQSFSVQPGASLSFTVNLELVRGVLKDLGREDIQLPDNLDGAVVEMDIPTGVAASYGECDFEPEPGQIDPDNSRPLKFDLENCTTLMQIPSPQVSAPPDLDLKQIGEAYLQVLGMSAEEAGSFARNLDWTTTFVIPLPRYYAEYEEVSVDGTLGTLIYRPRGYDSGYTLMWIKNGMIYALSGKGDRSEALQVAASIQ